MTLKQYLNKLTSEIAKDDVSKDEVTIGQVRKVVKAIKNIEVKAVRQKKAGSLDTLIRYVNKDLERPFKITKA